MSYIPPLDNVSSLRLSHDILVIIFSHVDWFEYIALLPYCSYHVIKAWRETTRFGRPQHINYIIENRGYTINGKLIGHIMSLGYFDPVPHPDDDPRLDKPLGLSDPDLPCPRGCQCGRMSRPEQRQLAMSILASNEI